MTSMSSSSMSTWWVFDGSSLEDFCLIDLGLDEAGGVWVCSCPLRPLRDSELLFCAVVAGESRRRDAGVVGGVCILKLAPCKSFSSFGQLSTPVVRYRKTREQDSRHPLGNPPVSMETFRCT